MISTCNDNKCELWNIVSQINNPINLFFMDGKKEWIYEITGDKRYVDSDTKTIFMPYNVEPKDYSQKIRDFMSSGWVVQIEIV